MNLKQMEYFIAIVNEGSISAAAKALHVSQPPLSAQMKLLEEELVLTLFERGSRNIILTDAGKILYERAQGILDMTGAVIQELGQMGQGLHGSLRLGMISSDSLPKSKKTAHLMDSSLSVPAFWFSNTCFSISAF